MNKAFTDHLSNEMLVLRILEKEDLSKAQIQQKIYDSSHGMIDLTMGLITRVIVQLYHDLAITSQERESGESVYSITDIGREMLHFKRMDYEKHKRGIDGLLNSDVVVSDKTIGDEEAYRENMLYIFFSSYEYAAAEGTLYKMVREAFMMGWRAAVNRSDVGSNESESD